MPTPRRAALLALAALLAGAAPSPDARDVRRLESWAVMDGGARDRIGAEELSEAVQGAVSDPGGDRQRADRALLAFAGSARARLDEPGEADRLEVALAGVRRRLAGTGGPGFLAWTCDRVLTMRASFGRDERLGACVALLGVPGDRPVLPLAQATEDPDPLVALAALEALVGRPSVTVHRRFLSGAERGGGVGPAARLLARHLEAVLAAAGPEADPTALLEARERGRVADVARAGLVAEDWRGAEVGARLARFLALRVSAPMLVEALGLWTEREAALPDDRPPVGLRRVRYAIAGVLQDRTGVRIGPHPDRWRAFWGSVREDPEALARSRSDQLAAGATVGDFFGVELRSGAVAFVLDASGSMDNAWIPDTATRNSTERPASRWQAAREQLGGFLARSETVWFQVALFSDLGVVWRDEPSQADDAARRAVDAWLRSQSPRGGTRLAAGLEAVLGVEDPDGRGPQFDTVVVLCDGETQEGAALARGAQPRRPPRLPLRADRFGPRERVAHARGGDRRPVPPRGSLTANSPAARGFPGARLQRGGARR